MDTIRKQKKEGIALLLAIAFVVVMGIIATGLFSAVGSQSRHIESYSQMKEAYGGAQTGYYHIAELSEDINMPVGFDATLGAGETYQGKLMDAIDQFYAGDVTGPMAVNRYVQFSAYEARNQVPGVYDENIVVAGARYMNHGNQTTSALIMQIDRDDLSVSGGGENPFDKAIFAGNGQSGLLINGNVHIHGPIHILGESLGEFDTALEMSGTSGQFNNFDDLPAIIETNLSPNTRTTVTESGTSTGAANGAYTSPDGEETLAATLAVANGWVSINGSTQYGQDDQDAGSKGNLDGVYVNNQWQGNSTTDGVPNAGHVFSDNGFVRGFDDQGGDVISAFPNFDQVVDETTGQIFFDRADPTSWYREDVTSYPGDISITATNVSGNITDNLYYNATTGAAPVLGLPTTDPSMPTLAEVQAMIPDPFIDTITEEYEGESFIWFDGATSTLVVAGRVPVAGDFSLLKGTGQNKTINYQGIGTILCYDPDLTTNPDVGYATVEVNLYTTGYPVDNFLIILADKDFDIGVSAQLELMACFYSQTTIAMNKQNVVAGALVADSFDLGSQVPSIYHIPMVAEMVNEYSDAIRAFSGGDDGGNTPSNFRTGVWFESSASLYE